MAAVDSTLLIVLLCVLGAILAVLVVGLVVLAIILAVRCRKAHRSRSPSPHPPLELAEQDPRAANYNLPAGAPFQQPAAAAPGPQWQQPEPQPQPQWQQQPSGQPMTMVQKYQHLPDRQNNQYQVQLGQQQPSGPQPGSALRDPSGGPSGGPSSSANGVQKQQQPHEYSSGTVGDTNESYDRLGEGTNQADDQQQGGFETSRDPTSFDVAFALPPQIYSASGTASANASK